MGAEGMGKIGEYDTNLRGRIQSAGDILQGSGLGVTIIWIGMFGNVDSNRENGGRDTYLVSETNHEGLVAAGGRRDVVYTSSGGSTGIGGNSVGNNLY